MPIVSLDDFIEHLAEKSYDVKVPFHSDDEINFVAFVNAHMALAGHSEIPIPTNAVMFVGEPPIAYQPGEKVDLAKLKGLGYKLNVQSVTDRWTLKNGIGYAHVLDSRGKTTGYTISSRFVRGGNPESWYVLEKAEPYEVAR